ncbi:MAG: TonB-dependent receptor [Pseudomonadota bacterium]
MPGAAQQSAAGFPFPQIWLGRVQPPHESPIAPLAAFGGSGLSDPARPGFAPLPVLSFFPALRQHRDSGPTPPLPLFAFDRAQFFMPHREDHVRLPAETFETLRTTAQSFKLTAGYATPGDTYQTFGQWTLRRPEGYVRSFVNAAGTTSDSFETGGGEEVPYEFRLNTQQLVLGYTPSQAVEVFGSFVRSEIDDFTVPSAPLDNIETDRLIGRAGVELREGGLGFDRLRAEVAVRDGERVNNNFDLRPFTPGLEARRQQVENERQFIDAEILGDMAIGLMEHRFVVGFGREIRDGLRFSDSDPTSAEPLLDIVSAVTFPDIEILQVSARWEGALTLTEVTQLTVGAQYRSVWAEAGATDQVPEGPFSAIVPGLAASASNLYDFYYGATDTNPQFNLFDVRALVQHEITPGTSLFGEVAHFERAPDSKELFFAATAPPPVPESRIIGNPSLDKERHLRLGAGLVAAGADWIAFGRSRRSGEGLQTGAWQFSAGLSYERVDDFISRDRARGQPGVLVDDGASVFRNVDAVFYRAEADLAWNLTPRLSAKANLIYTFGDNREEDRPLYGVAPLEGNLLLDWTDSFGPLGTYSLGSKLRLVAEQTRVDDDPTTGSGFDDGETDSFAVLDLYAAVLIRDRVAVQVGIENIFDADYAEHVPASPIESARRFEVGAPGRAVYIRGGVAF